MHKSAAVQRIELKMLQARSTRDIKSTEIFGGFAGSRAASVPAVREELSKPLK
jgi:hypothetical protein